MTLSGESETPRHSIGVASRRSGLKPDLIRAWERRYGVVKPSRSDTRRRRYSDAQVRRLRLLRQAVRGGRNIGDIAHLPDRSLEELIAGDAVAVRAVGDGSLPAGVIAAPGDVEEAAAAILDACVAAVQQLDPGTLELELERASVALSRAHLLDRLLTPLMVRIGDLWQDGSLRPVHEHLASSIVRSFVGGLRRAHEGPRGAPCMLLTTPVRQRHELGALMAAATSSSEGWRVLYLGPDLPAEEIAAGALACEARAVGLSLVYPPDDPSLPGELVKLRRLLGDSTELLFGGRSAPAYRPAVDRIGGRLVEDLAELREILGDLRMAD